jgi:acyl-CoA thioesterase FadM
VIRDPADGQRNTASHVDRKGGVVEDLEGRPPMTYRHQRLVPADPRYFHGGGRHLSNVGSAEIITDAVLSYFREEICWYGPPPPEVTVPFRRLSLSYESEAFHGDELFCGVGVESRGARTLRLSGAIWVGDRARRVVDAEIVLVSFNKKLRKAVQVPADLVRRIEEYEGRTLQTR